MGLVSEKRSQSQKSRVTRKCINLLYLEIACDGKMTDGDNFSTTLAYTKSPKVSKRTTFQDELQAAISARAGKHNTSTEETHYYSDDFDDVDEDGRINPIPAMLHFPPLKCTALIGHSKATFPPPLKSGAQRKGPRSGEEGPRWLAQGDRTADQRPGARNGRQRCAPMDRRSDD
ncbi:UNVERIFIED_CONTAM: hypothetical protein FKN15_043204 [Acipenser sinensis]